MWMVTHVINEVYYPSLRTNLTQHQTNSKKQNVSVEITGIIFYPDEWKLCFINVIQNKEKSWPIKILDQFLWNSYVSIIVSTDVARPSLIWKCTFKAMPNFKYFSWPRPVQIFILLQKFKKSKFRYNRVFYR